ncbi:Conserved_hypothetical protein [Hexamita inflata]|uniref:Uncharacterized protein n=1 Tax=Hexamita inflata TaxID=28002 RepID=A0AA86PZU9_9EUKA|nr:Conserved hypothetical protein [Hexamita inflata]CAI9949505.1 Conserved hypothetical protein [Hexamita inflata]
MIMASIVAISVSSSFSECFSAKSYINGNSVTNQLNLHLLPFERLDKITSENLCKMYLPGKVVVAQIHYDDMSFPRPGDAEVNFLYQFNQEIVVSFTLTPADYLHIMDKQNAMYELWYDVNLVKVNNSVNTIEHTKYNGTNCFQKVEILYTIYGDIDIKVAPNSCSVAIDPNLQVYLEFQEGLQNNQLPVYPCASNCAPNEYQASSTDFSQITLYRVKQSPSIAPALQSFYSHFIENRNISITFNLRFNSHGLYSVISRPLDKFLANDTWGCMEVHVVLASTLNPNSFFMQYRDSLTNKLVCDTQDAVKVKIDIQIWDMKNKIRLQREYKIEDFNEEVGSTFENTPELVKLRQDFDVLISKTIIVVSYLNADGRILWEIITYEQAYIGCVSRATLHLYEDKNCLKYAFDDHPQCLMQFINATDKNTLGLFYKENGKTQSLGFYRFHYPIDYKVLYQGVCFVCDQFIDDTTYVKPTCRENQEYTKKVLKTATIGLGIISSYESIILNTVVAEYQTVFVPFVVCSSIVAAAVAITIAVFLHKAGN